MLGPTCASSLNKIGPPLLNSLQILDSDPCHAANLCISSTRLLRAPLAEFFCLSSNFAFRGKGSETLRESIEPLD